MVGYGYGDLHVNNHYFLVISNSGYSSPAKRGRAFSGLESFLETFYSVQWRLIEQIHLPLNSIMSGREKALPFQKFSEICAHNI